MVRWGKMDDNKYYSNSIFWIETEKIKPNPFQPRREFDEAALQSLADSIRQYGVLQPLVVTRKEVTREDGGLATEYELVAGERRLRASRLAGVVQVPAVIRGGHDSDREKLELAIIENLQREDLNPVDRAKAFAQLVQQFNLKHFEIGKKIGKSREYVSNSIRILALPEHMIQAVVDGKIMEGHTRPILMLAERPQEQETLYQEIMLKRLNVREAEKIARGIAIERTRKKDKQLEPEVMQMERQLTEKLGTRVRVEWREVGGKLTIDFFTPEDLHTIVDILNGQQGAPGESGPAAEISAPAPDQSESEDLYNIKNFSV